MQIIFYLSTYPHVNDMGGDYFSSAEYYHQTGMTFPTIGGINPLWAMYYPGHRFSHWNSKQNDTGDSYYPGDTIPSTPHMEGTDDYYQFWWAIWDSFDGNVVCGTTGQIVPTSFDSTNSVYYGTASNVDNALKNANSTSTTYAEFGAVRGSGAETFIYYKFNSATLNAIPDSAIVEGRMYTLADSDGWVVNCKAPSIRSTPQSPYDSYFTTRQVQFCIDTTPIGNPLTLNSSMSTWFTNPKIMTGAQVKNLSARTYLKRSTSNVNTSQWVHVYGAHIEVIYTYFTYPFNITNSASDNSVTVSFSSFDVIEGTTGSFTITNPQNKKLVIIDNGVNVATTSASSYTYSVSNVQNAHNILIKLAYLWVKPDLSWQPVQKGYIKTANGWVQQSDLSNLFVSGGFYNYMGYLVDPVLNNNPWNIIQQVTQNGEASSYWAIGDGKEVTINGTLTYRQLSTNTPIQSFADPFNNETYYAFIIGFDHNSTVELNSGHGITFQIGRTALSGGTDICLTRGYGNTVSPRFEISRKSTTEGGWELSYMRNQILGVSLFNNGATPLIELIPKELKNVLKQVKKYTNNYGDGVSGSSYVTPTYDYLYLPAEYEIFGVRTSADNYEQSYQQQYTYYNESLYPNNSKIKYKSEDTTVAATWWLRSPVYNSDTSFCAVNTSGIRVSETGTYGRGVAPCFTVG